MPLTTNQSELLRRFAHVPQAVAAAVQRAARQPQPAGAWSLRTMVIHLLQVDTEIWSRRLTMMIEQDNPQWMWTEPDLAALETRYAALSESELLATFT